jgi:hypothetical protein
LGLGSSCDLPSILAAWLLVGWAFVPINLHRTALWLRIGTASGIGAKVA